MRLVFIYTLSMISFWAFAQNDSTRTQQGEVLTGEVVIEKNKKIVLPQADKVYQKSVLPSYGDETLPISFKVNEPDFSWPDYKSDVPFHQVDDPYPLAEYQNYVKAGYGNFNSPLFEAGLFQQISNWDSRAKLFYEHFNSGPVYDENSGNSEASIDVSATHQKNHFRITPEIGFNYRQYNFYGNSNRVNDGYSEDKPDESSFSNFNGLVMLEWEKDDVALAFIPFASTAIQSIDPGESENTEATVGAKGKLSFRIDNAFTTGFTIEGQSAGYDGGIEYDRSLINVVPWVAHTRDNLTIRAGFTVSSGKVDAESRTSFYPNARVDYSLSNKWSVYGILEGGQQWNALQSLIGQNQFLDDSLVIAHTEKTFSLGGGIKGSPLKDMILETSLTHSRLEGLPFFVPSSSDSARYVLAYDGESTSVTTLKAKLSFMPTTTSTYGANLELNGYSTRTIDKAWHLPTFVFTAYTSHNIKEKLIVSAHMTSMGGIKSPANVDFGYVKLPSFIDLGLSAKYLITPRASAFIDVNNLLNNEYERYLGYPIRGLAFKIGGQYRF